MSWPTTQAERDQRIIEMRYQRANGMTLAAIARLHDITRERVRQILSKDHRRQRGQIERDLQEIEWMLMDPIHRAAWRMRKVNGFPGAIT